MRWSSLDFSSKKFTRNEKEIILEKYEDHFDIVFTRIGTPKEEDLEFITDKTALKFLQKFPPKTPVNWLEMYPDSSAEALDLLQRMLELNPKKRITLDEYLYHPFFIGIENKTPEQKIEGTIDLTINLKLNENLSMAQMKMFYIEEITYYKRH